MAKKNDSNFKKAMNELLGTPSEVKKEVFREEVKTPVKEENKKAAAVTDAIFRTNNSKPMEEAVIPAGMVITGNITSKSNIRIEGSIVGDITCEGDILLVGNVEGNVAVDNIVIQNGSMKGDVTAKGDVTLEAESSLKGNLAAGNVYSNASSQGQIVATGTVDLKNCAFVHGDITAATFSVASGAKIKGAVTINE